MLPDAIIATSDFQLSLRGTALWKGDRGPRWIEPFVFSVTIAATADPIEGYYLKFGDASRGLARVPWDKQLRWVTWFYPDEWLFELAKPTNSAAQPSLRSLALR